MAASKATRIGVLALASAATLYAVWQVNERDKRLAGGETPAARDGALRADAAPGRTGSEAGAENWLGLLRRVPIAAQSAGELFSSSSWAPPPAPPPPAVKPVETPPPFPFVYLGKSVLDSATRLYLTRAVPPNAPPGPVFMVSSGETLDGSYRIDSVTDDSLAVTYLPMNKPQTLTLASLVADAGKPQPPGTPVSAGPDAFPAAQAYVPQPLAAVAPGAATSAAGLPFGGASIAGAAAAGPASAAASSSGAPLSAAAVPSAFSTAGSPATVPAAAFPTIGNSGTVFSAINPGAAPVGVLGGQPVGSGILGVPVNINSPIGFEGAVSPGSMPTGSGAPSGPGPVAK